MRQTPDGLNYGVVAGEEHRDSLRSEVVLLAKPEDLLDHLRIGLGRLMVRHARPVVQPLDSSFVEPSPPHVAALPADAVVAAGRGAAATDFLDVTQHSECVLPDVRAMITWNPLLSIGFRTSHAEEVLEIFASIDRL